MRSGNLHTLQQQVVLVHGQVGEPQAETHGGIDQLN